MASNILQLPFRRTLPVELGEAIQQYISSKYDQHPAMFKADLDDIERLRNDAVNAVEPHASGVRTLQAYAAQLSWMGGKFPIDIGVDFTWYAALGYNSDWPTSENNLRFELANIVFNLAAMYSQIAMASNRSTADGLKTACNYFCLCAGTISHLRTTIVPDMRTTPPQDMDSSTLESLEQLFLAQAQELFWQKAVKDGMKDAIIAKLAAKVSDLYSNAADHGIKSDAISSEWIHHMTAKHHHFAAAAQYRQACDCLEKRRYGEEVARLRDSLNCVNEALKESRYVNKTVQGDLNGLKSKVQDDLKRAEKDNDMIFFQTVPPKPELKTLDRASMVSSKIPKEIADPISMLGTNSELGRPLFAKLVPYSVHVAASIYADRRDRLIKTDIIDRLEEMNARMHDLLQSLNLPGSLQALEKPLGIPSATFSHAEDIRQQDGFNRLWRTINDTEKVRNDDRAIYQTGVDLLRAEQMEDEEARGKFGTNAWRRQPSATALPQLYAQIKEIEGYFVSAESSDKVVLNKLQESERFIRLLSGTDRDLEDFIPSSRRNVVTAKVDKEASRLRNCLNDINRLESRRRRKIENIRAKAQSDDVNPDLLKEAARLEREYPMQSVEAVQFEDFFEMRLARYDTDRKAIDEEEHEQQQYEDEIRTANTGFQQARQGDTSSKDREKALQQLENAYYKYKEISSNLEAARKFYNGLNHIVTRFRDEARACVYARRAEAGRIETDMSTSLSSLSISQTSNPQLQYQSPPPQQQQQQQGYNMPPPSAPVPNAPVGDIASPPPHLQHGTMQPHTPNPAPIRPTWTPDMPIKFGGVATPSTVPGQQQQQPSYQGQSPYQQQNQQQQPQPQPQQGGANRTWNPNQGIQFGR